MRIHLNPPPDLVVTSITTLANYYTGDVMEVHFNVSNKGLGEPFYYWWRDRLVSGKLSVETWRFLCFFKYFITSRKRVLRPRTPSFSRSHDSSRQQSFMISWAYESFTFKKPNLFITKEKFSVQTLDGMKYIVMSITKLYRRKMKSKILLKGLPRMNKLPSF